MKKIFLYTYKKIIALFIIGAIVFFYRESLLNTCYKVEAYVAKDYQKNKDLILPYFDEQFYLSHYGDQVNASGLTAIDHYLQRGWRGEWQTHTDPNTWFNTTLYKERLWYKPAKFYQFDINPFVDFMKQLQNTYDHTADIIHIYATQEELPRAWLAAEGFLRLNKYQVILHVSSNVDTKELIRFETQINRGLSIKMDNDQNNSFYQSPFLQTSYADHITDLPVLKDPDRNQMVSRVQSNKKPHHIWHQLYNPFKWRINGKLDPCMINIGHYADEPIVYSRYGKTIEDFSAYMKRIAEGFDLLLLNTNIGTKNSVIIPGYLYAWVNEEELSQNKTYDVSFLLSMGGGSWSSFRERENLNYNLRKNIWDSASNLNISTKFYLSFRDKHKFPKDMQTSALPTDSKKWVFNSQFNIAVENTAQEHYFTEKLLGCFISLTVPIYIGCPNIGDYFDTRGMFIATSVEDVKTICASITPEIYDKMLPYLKENKKRAEELIKLEEKVLGDFFKKMIYSHANHKPFIK